MLDQDTVQSLWEAVLMRVLEDIQKADRGVEGYSHFVTAARWVGTFPSREFSEVCALAGYEADFLHPQFRRLVQKAEKNLQEKRTPRVMAAE